VRVSRRTLEVLDFPQLVERLEGHTRTPGGRRRCAPEAVEELFAPDLAGMREALARTGEARALLREGAAPVGPVAELEALLARAERGGTLAADELRNVASAIEALGHAARTLAARAPEAPRLAALGAGLGDHRETAREVDRALDPEGGVRDAASPLLAASRAESRRLAADIQRRLDSALRDPGVSPYLSDSFVTVRNDRYVLPVRADARGRVRGIVHDASASGTTLFVEPEVVVDANNRLKEAELRVQRETARILRELSEAVGREAPGLRTSLGQLAEIDLAFARAALSEELDAIEPEVRDAGVLRLPQLRHPLLVEAAVPNDVRLGEAYRILVLSGPNAGGKTVAMKSVALAALSARAGLHVAAGAGARVDWLEGVLADVGDAQSLRESLSTFSAHLANLARIVESADSHTLVVLDEIGDGTDPGEGAALAQAVLETLADAGARVIATTHYNLLKELAAVDPRFENGSFEFDPETLAPTFRLRIGTPGVSSATAVAARMGLRRDVVERANELLDREDRRLERMLSELASSRLALEGERREAERLRAETQAERDALRARIEQLQERRDRLYGEMRADLERSFRRAHEEVAGVIRELQRGGRARDAERAREKLRILEEQARREAAQAGVRRPGLAPVDWRRAKAGDPVVVDGGGTGALLSLPDRHGRVGVRVGSARLVVPVERVGAAPAPDAAALPRSPRVSLDLRSPAGADGAGVERCDLRGLRVEEALARVDAALDRAALTGRSRVVFVHGIGTGALRDAVREHLSRSVYVVACAAGTPDTGGEGVTEARLRDA
jgi:DNA mismatch repair protein MutS2